MANPVGDLLFVIVDAGPEAWDGLDAVTDKFSIRAFANSLALFIKSHLMLHWTNKAVILAHNRQERCVGPGDGPLLFSSLTPLHFY